MHFGLHPNANMIMPGKNHICPQPVPTFSFKSMNCSICDRLIGQPHRQTHGSLLTECWVSSSSPSRWERCLQPCLLLCPAKRPPSCSILLRRGCQQHVPSSGCLDPWVTAAQRTPTSSELPALGAAPATPSPCSTEWSRNRQGVLHTPCPHRPGEQEGTASPGNTWNTCRPQCSQTTGLPSTPRDFPSLDSSFSSLPPHSWTCLTLAGQGFALSFPPRECTSSLGLCKGLGLDWNFALWGHSYGFGVDFPFQESALQYEHSEEISSCN